MIKKQLQYNYDGRFQLQRSLLGRMIYWSRRKIMGQYIVRFGNE